MSRICFCILAMALIGCPSLEMSGQNEDQKMEKPQKVVPEKAKPVQPDSVESIREQLMKTYREFQLVAGQQPENYVAMARFPRQIRSYLDQLKTMLAKSASLETTAKAADKTLSAQRAGKPKTESDAVSKQAETSTIHGTHLVPDLGEMKERADRTKLRQQETLRIQQHLLSADSFAKKIEEALREESLDKKTLAKLMDQLEVALGELQPKKVEEKKSDKSTEDRPAKKAPPPDKKL